MTQSQPCLHLRVLGTPAAYAPNGERLGITNRKGMCILSYMALTGTKEARREKLQSLLWSEKSKSRAQGSLRNSLKHLSDGLESSLDGVVWRDKRAFFVDLERVRLDIEDVYNHAKSGNFQPLLDHGFAPEEILSGLENEDEAFLAWLRVIRNLWHEKFVTLLEAQLSDNLTEAQVDAARALIAIEPAHEIAYRALIRYHAQAGNAPKAIALYDQLFQFLRDEVDAEPSQATFELIADVKMGRVPSSLDVPAHRPVARMDAALNGELVTGNGALSLRETVDKALPADVFSRTPTIGVADFQQSGFWRSESFLIDGFRRDLIAALVRFREWTVIDNSAETMKSEADYVLEGGYQDNVGTVRLTITLRQSATGVFLWSEPLEFGFDQWLEVQSEIVRRIAIALNVSVAYNHLSRSRDERSLPADLYSLWLQGQELLLQWDAKAHSEATRIFQSITDQRPDFARAHSSLAQIGNAASIIVVGRHRTKDSIMQTVERAKMAVDADPLDSRAHLALAWARMSNKQFELAEMELDHASNLNGNDPWTLVSVALGWAYLGNVERSHHFSDLGLRLGLRPNRSHWGYQTCRRYLVDDFEGCIEAAQEGGSAFHNLAAWAAASHSRLGQPEEANQAASRFRKGVLAEWAAETDPTDAAILDWLLQCFPIKSDTLRARFRSDLINAGLDGS